MLENALRLSGVVLVRDTAGYRLTPLGEAVGAGRVDAAASSAEPGYGVSVVPLQHVSAQTLLTLMDSFATKAGMVRADTTRNLLLIQGSGAERRTAVDTALSTCQLCSWDKYHTNTKGNKNSLSVARVAGHDLRAH